MDWKLALSLLGGDKTYAKSLLDQRNLQAQKESIQGMLQPLTQGQQVPYQLSPMESFGQEDPINQIQQYNPMAFTKNLPGLLNQQQAEGLSGLAAQNPNIIPSLLGQVLPQQQKIDPNLLEYQQAKQIGLIPSEMSYIDYLGIKKNPLVNIESEKPKPVPLSEYNNLIDIRTGKPPKPNENLIMGNIPPYIIATQKPGSAETAGKQAMVDTAISQLPIIKNTLFENGNVETGKINNDILLPAEIVRSNIPLVSRFAKVVASPDAQRLANAYEFGLQGITRFETGAAMASSEISNTANRFFPINTDPEDVKRSKVKAYELFLHNAKNYIDPDKINRGSELKSSDINFEKLFNDAKNNLNKPIKTWSDSVYEYRTLPDGRTQRRLK